MKLRCTLTLIHSNMFFLLLFFLQIKTKWRQAIPWLIYIFPAPLRLKQNEHKIYHECNNFCSCFFSKQNEDKIYMTVIYNIICFFNFIFYYYFLDLNKMKTWCTMSVILHNYMLISPLLLHIKTKRRQAVRLCRVSCP